MGTLICKNCEISWEKKYLNVKWCDQDEEQRVSVYRYVINNLHNLPGTNLLKMKCTGIQNKKHCCVSADLLYCFTAVGNPRGVGQCWSGKEEGGSCCQGAQAQGSQGLQSGRHHYQPGPPGGPLRQGGPGPHRHPPTQTGADIYSVCRIRFHWIRIQPQISIRIQKTPESGSKLNVVK